MMSHEKDMCLSELHNVNKPFPRHQNGLSYYYDQEILTFYNVSTKTSGQDFFTRGFIKRMCRTVNKMNFRERMSALNMKMVFDQVESSKAVLCRFHLPVKKDERHQAIQLLYDLYISNEDWVGKIISNQAYFTMISYSLQ